MDTMVSREQSLRGKLSEKIEDLKRQKNQIQALEDQLVNMRQRLRDEENEHELTKEQRDDKDVSLKKKEHELKELEKDLENEQKDRMETEETLKRDIELYIDMTKKLVDESESQSENHKKLKKDVKNLSDANEFLKSNLVAAEEQVQAKDENCKKMKAEIAQLKTALHARNDFEKSFADDMCNLEDELQRRIDERLNLLSSMDEMKDSLSESQEVVKSLSDRLEMKNKEIDELQSHIGSQSDRDTRDEETETEFDVVIREKPKPKMDRDTQMGLSPIGEETELLKLRRKLKDAFYQIELLQTQLRTVGSNEREQKAELDCLRTLQEAYDEQNTVNYELNSKLDQTNDAIKELEIKLDTAERQKAALTEILTNWENSALKGDKDQGEFISLPTKEFQRMRKQEYRMHDLEEALVEIDKEGERNRQRRNDAKFQCMVSASINHRHQTTQTTTPEQVIFTSTGSLKSAISEHLSSDDPSDAKGSRNTQLNVLHNLLNMIPKLNRVRLERGVIEVNDVYLDDCGLASLVCPRKYETSVHAQLRLIASGNSEAVNNKLAAVHFEQNISMPELLEFLDEDPVVDNLSRFSPYSEYVKSLEKTLKARTQLVFESWFENERLYEQYAGLSDILEKNGKEQKALQEAVANLHHQLKYPDQDIYDAVENVMQQVKEKNDEMDELKHLIDQENEKIRQNVAHYMRSLENSGDLLEELKQEKAEKEKELMEKNEETRLGVKRLETDLNLLRDAVMGLPGGRDLIRKFDANQIASQKLAMLTNPIADDVMNLVSQRFPDIAKQLSDDQASGLEPHPELLTLPPPENVRLENFVGTCSVLVTWTVPKTTSVLIIQGFQVYVDNVKSGIVHSPIKDQAIVLLSKIDRPSLISVQSVSNTFSSKLVTVLFPGREAFELQMLNVTDNGSNSNQENAEMVEKFDQKLVKKQIAKFDYDPKNQSPNENPDMELEFRKGAIITTYGDVRPDNYFYGEVNGRAGLVPSNFVFSTE